MTRPSLRADAAAYAAPNELFLWLVTDPSAPVLVGDLALVRAVQGVSLTYDPSWLSRGFALSEDLPLTAGERMPRERNTAAGAVDDARPDRWGERVITVVDKPPRRALLDYLYFAGNDRFGALGVSTSRTVYVPRARGPLPKLADVAAIEVLVRKVLQNEPVRETERRLISPGASMGGAKPKALVEIDGVEHVVKFGPEDPNDTPLIEHASMTLARKAGIRTATTKPVRLVDGHAVAVARFDRKRGRRVHALSANVALKAAGETTMGYPELAQLLRRRGVVAKDANVSQMRELFRRMVFNILIDNTDDHEKNHVLLMDDAEQYELSPAFDALPSGQALGYQQMRVGVDENDATLTNALSMCDQFALKSDAAIAEVRRVIRVVNRWREHFVACGVTKRDIEALVEQIDRPFLADQRRELNRSSSRK